MAARAGSSEPITDYESLLGLVIDHGVDPELVRVGSIPAASLDFMLERIDGGPGLHVGNYAGVSLAYLAARIDGVIVAVDPNIEHWGLPDPQDTVVRVLRSGWGERSCPPRGRLLAREEPWERRVDDRRL